MADNEAAAPEIIRSLTLERSIYIGNAFALILYGLNLYMYGQSVYFLLTGNSGSFRKRMFYIIFGGVMTILITIATTTNAYFAQQIFIENRDFQLGPVGYYGLHISDWYNTFGSASDIAANFLGDGLLVYRCYIIWGGKWWVVILPACMYVASTVLAIMSVTASALPDASFFKGPSKGFGVPWIGLTVSLNVVVTAMICTRLILARRRVRIALTPQMSDMYTGLIAVLIESALPFTVLGLFFLYTFAKELEIAIAFAFVWGTLVAVAPQLIILRVSMGKAWTKTTATQFSTGNSMAFHTGSHHRNIGLDTFNSAKNGGGSTTVASTQASYDKYKSSNSLTNV
ncbi:hypothetical protein BDV98DRAFT_583588 [Pterulicium gracile]|uniref:Fungal pheromone mating factor STE2 GPCR-domain-containing protein n=1 Tax=Pterulicium gracile TaxID=1884261 RepID=A0A5C3QF58_9AGAR|nr:hypothetical protein BDV98DRAFT_583588 [Pterula gracilis]